MLIAYFELKNIVGFQNCLLKFLFYNIMGLISSADSLFVLYLQLVPYQQRLDTWRVCQWLANQKSRRPWPIMLWSYLGLKVVEINTSSKVMELTLSFRVPNSEQNKQYICQEKCQYTCTNRDNLHVHVYTFELRCLEHPRDR